MSKKDGALLALFAYALLATLGLAGQWSEKAAWRQQYERQAELSKIETDAAEWNQRAQANLREARDRLDAVRRGEQVGPPVGMR